MKTLVSVAALALTILLGACGGSPAVVTAPTSFPTTANLPTLQITNRVVNLNGTGSGYKYAKLSLSVVFADPKGDFLKANGASLTKLESTFSADNAATIAAFNDVVTTDVSTKTPEQLATAQGKEALRQQLTKDFNSRLAGGPPVLYVEYVDFVMQ